MPTDSNDELDVDKLLAELKNEDSEESKNSKNPFKDKKNDDTNNYDYKETADENDFEW